MKNRTSTTWIGRTSAAGLGLALVAGLALAAIPAHAATPGPIDVSETSTPTPAPDEVVPTLTPTPEAPAPIDTPSPEPSTPTPWSPTAPPVTFKVVPTGEVSISGAPSLGNTLTAVLTDWPAGTSFEYSWGIEGHGYISGAHASSFTVTAAEADAQITVSVVGSLDGYLSRTAFASLPMRIKPTAAAPVADSSALGDYLSSKQAQTQSQSSAGLPTGALTPDKTYTVNLTWSEGADRFVDVYLYSAPTLVGSFPVVDGTLQVPLTAALLQSVGAGTHTLVVMGQTSHIVQAVTLTVAASPSSARTALAETGVAVTWPLTAAAVFLLLGAVLVGVRRRRAQA